MGDIRAGSVNEYHSGRLARTAGLVMLASLTGRGLGLLREVIIGLEFGTSRELDAYLAAFRTPDLLFQLLAAGLAWWAAPSLIGQVVAPGFDAVTQHLTVDLMRLMLAHATLQILARAFYALHDTQTLVQIGAAAMLLNVLLSLLLMRSLAHGGLAWANSLGPPAWRWWGCCGSCANG